MKITRIPLLAVAAVTLAAPLTCLATPSSVAVDNCAQALASRLHAHLAAVHQQPNFYYPLIPSRDNQYVLTAQENRGAAPIPMLCTVDRHGQVMSLHRVADAQAALFGDDEQWR
ncbi:MAG TPA: hypothetical protein VMF64_13210 [Steroidobacteraceae bacterium]|nr:hypothetical protein [Steroidobacteraceae bacterium]